MAATLTQDDIDLIVAGVLGADPRVFAIQGEITGDLEIERFGAISLTFTENTDPNIASSIVAGGENAELAAQLDTLEAQILLIKAKTDQITPEGTVYVSEASQGRIPNTRAYVIAVDLTANPPKPITGIANTLSAKWQKDGGNRENLTTNTATEEEDGVYYFPLSEAERTFAVEARLYPESSNANVQVFADPHRYTILESLIWSKAGLINSGVTISSAPVLASGEFAEPLVIGDDYLVANNRALSWTIAASVTPVLAKLGFRHRKDSTEKYTLSASDGRIVSLGSNQYRLDFEQAAAVTLGKRPGDYEYSLDIRDGDGNKITFRHSHFFAEDGTPARNYATLVERFTEDE